MEFIGEDLILVKSLHNSKGYNANERVSWKRLEEKWTELPVKKWINLHYSYQYNK